jgi:membrane protein implicated in regulation of membrane protease activity
MTRRADGTIGHPYSALNLRLALALTGVVSMLILAGLAFAYHAVPVAVLALLVAVAAAVNAAVVQYRRRERRRTDPSEHRSMFE